MNDPGGMGPVNLGNMLTHHSESHCRQGVFLVWGFCKPLTPIVSMAPKDHGENNGSSYQWIRVKITLRLSKKAQIKYATIKTIWLHVWSPN